jgi:hypothetical protein
MPEVMPDPARTPGLMLVPDRNSDHPDDAGRDAPYAPKGPPDAATCRAVAWPACPGDARASADWAKREHRGTFMLARMRRTPATPITVIDTARVLLLAESDPASVAEALTRPAWQAGMTVSRSP